MANAKKCDACGAYYEEYRQRLAGGFPADGMLIFSRAFSGPALRVDLCPDCLDIIAALAGVKREEG